MQTLSNGLDAAGRYTERLGVILAEMAIQQRFDIAFDEEILSTQTNLANCYDSLGQSEKALELRRAVHARNVALGRQDENAFVDTFNYSLTLVKTGRCTEAKSFLREQLPKARRALSPENDVMIRLRWTYAEALRVDDRATRKDLIESVKILEELSTSARRIYGPGNPTVKNVEHSLECAYENLGIALRELESYEERLEERLRDLEGVRDLSVS